jgi:uncharacterized protein YbbC (DUF1343 family)
MPVFSGLDRIAKKWPRKLRKSRVGLLVHPASVNRLLEHASSIFHKSQLFELKAFFGPQHGIRGETQDNMIEWRDFRDPRAGLPVYSLYGETRKPTPEMLADIDVLAVDMQDVGARYYTFIWTMDLCMQACAELGKSVIVLDRPNPITGSSVEGPVLAPAFSSFVGLRPVPVRHGMTIGEIALYLKNEFYPALDLHVVPMQGWKRTMWFDETGLPWVLPSPNMPTPETALVYPGMCLLEGTMLSEGRGTTRPFEIFGAPFISGDALAEQLNKLQLPGVWFRPLFFEPTFQKHAGELCGGAQIHITDRKKFRSFKTGAAVLSVIRRLYPDEPLWKSPPYEYEREKMPIDILAGTDRLRNLIDSGASPDGMEEWWQPECAVFAKQTRKKYLLYE